MARLTRLYRDGPTVSIAGRGKSKSAPLLSSDKKNECNLIILSVDFYTYKVMKLIKKVSNLS